MAYRHCSALLLSIATAASAAPIAYDGFGNGPLADLNGSSGGTGWTSPWQDIASNQITTVELPGLTYPLLPTTPGAAITPSAGFYSAEYMRTFPTITSDDIFISFLLRPDVGSGSYGGLGFGGYYMVGQPLTSQNYGLRLGHYLFVDTGVPVVTGQTKLLVLELKVVGLQTSFKLYVNPNLAQGQPATPSAEYTLGGVFKPSYLELVNDAGFTTDEIRVATTWAEATTAPACKADLDNGSMTGTPDGGVDINDLLYFLRVFEMGSVRADLDDGSMTGTPDGGVDVSDLLFFLFRFELGC